MLNFSKMKKKKMATNETTFDAPDFGERAEGPNPSWSLLGDDIRRRKWQSRKGSRLGDGVSLILIFPGRTLIWKT